MADKMFWEDVAQAVDRLTGTYVMYGDDAVYVDRVEARPDGPSARISFPGGGSAWKLLTDDAFHDFHKLPPMGYVNVVGAGKPMAVLLTRYPERSRSHGIKSGKVAVADLTDKGLVGSRIFDFASVVRDKGYSYRIAGIYPSISEIVEKLEEGCSAAFDSKYAVVKDSFGLLRLFRRNAPVGLLNENGLHLSKTAMFYREEISELDNFNLNVIEVAA